MTKDEILALQAGKKLDALVAEKVLGWRKGRREYGEMDWYPDGGKKNGRLMTPNFSAEISEAWKIESKMAEREIEWRYTDNVKKILLKVHPEGVTDYLMMHAPAAVRCKAALLASLEVQRDETET